jgi:hypothetical protein
MSVDLDELRIKNEIPEDAVICPLEAPADAVLMDKQVGNHYVPPPLEFEAPAGQELREQLRALSELDDFADVLHTLPFITNDIIEEFGWESYIKDGSTMKRDYLKWKLQKKKNQLKNNRIKK